MAFDQLDKIYSPLKVEDKWYQRWLEKGLFHADAVTKKPRYTIMIPPPNVTGMLTMGHVLNNTVQDILIRWKHMDGYETLWMPGTDHAGIATQNKVEAMLKTEGLSRHDLGREKLVKRIWEWKEKYGGIILQQLKKLGASCDWERERFTMDEGLSRAVREVFVRLYEKGLIYRGRRLINWCPRCHTALADEEAPSSEKDGQFWHIAYPLTNGEGEIVVFTTRPETMLGDTAVAVHPDDKRYKKLIGETVKLPLTNREIPIIADEHADPQKGSGAVKITPAHDFDDFEVGQRNGLDLIQVIDENGFMNENAGSYRGLDRFEARRKIVDDLKGLGLLKGTEPRVIPIPKCYRCGTVVEPFLSDQWFVKMGPLAEPSIEAVRKGRIKFYPKHWEETYFHWMENIKDWCISRQIWWGHRIPAWTCPEGHVTVSRDTPNACRECGSTELTQDPDVLDTWFSSWLWPFSTLGWPDKTDDLKAFFPTDTLATGPDIIFFWVARMIMASLEFMGDIPFTDVYFNGMIRDLSGRKMSKSLGNSPDPLWLINGADKNTVKEFASRNPSYKKGIPAYGADAIRLTMVYLTPLGGDIHFDHTLVEFGQKFCNKIWNAARFVLMNLETDRAINSVKEYKHDDALINRWILSRLQKVIESARQSLETYRFNDAVRSLYSFTWNEFCDWYLEMVKPALYQNEDTEMKHRAQEVLFTVLSDILKLLHPFIPFITEEIYHALLSRVGKEDVDLSLMAVRYPVMDENFIDDEAEKRLGLIQGTITVIRNIRSEMNVPPGKKAEVFLKGREYLVDIIKSGDVYIKSLGSVDKITAGVDLERPAGSAMGFAKGVEIFIPLGGLIDIDVEKKRIAQEIERLENFITGIERKLINRDFIERAPKEVVNKEKQKQADAHEKLETLRKNLDFLI
ncbi:valine--tRNA ligase [bacterium]|nr:valine--tRNA ligase [bacterium]